MMKIATWNVNSIRARQERLLAWLAKERPDIACLQELKVTEEQYPYALLEEAGYHSAVFGQRTYNGVAILSRTDIGEVHRGLTGEPGEDARLVDAEVGGLHVINVYVPNGESVGSEKWAYKLVWLERFREYLDVRYSPDDPLVVCGDFNVAPEDRDVANPDIWRNSVLCHEDARVKLRDITRWGLADTLRLRYPEGGIYSWWDYRALSFPKNDGLRLDQIYATRPVSDRCTDAYVDREMRKGLKPSDHAPVVAIIDES